MRSVKKTYKKDRLTVVWDSSKCIHSGICARGLPTVFKPKESPWIQMENEDAERIRRQVEACPSGALSVQHPSL